MIKNNILINTETRKIKSRDYDFLGIAGENNIEQIVFKLSAFINGEAILEIEKYNKEDKLETHYFELQKQDESYVFEVKSSLLDVAKDVKMQLHITTENVEVFKSKIFTMKVYEAINATETIPEQYPEWIDIANSKIALIDKLNEDFTKLTEEVEQAETARNNKLNETVNKITDMTDDYNKTAKEKTDEFNSNVIKQTNEFNNKADKKEDELNEIVEGIHDMTTSFQFPVFDVEDGRVCIISNDKLANSNFGVEEGRIYKEVYV